MHNWRVSQLTRLGIPGPLAEISADRIDWHQVARLVQRGCPPQLALRIVRTTRADGDDKSYHSAERREHGLRVSY